MEIPGITLTDEVQTLITDLVNIDTRQRSEKVKSFLSFGKWTLNRESHQQINMKRIGFIFVES